MVKGAIKMKRQIELKNIEIGEYCMLDIFTGDKTFYDKPSIKEFTGLYFKDISTFFALYPTPNGPMMYYERKEYPLKKELHISVTRMEDLREFCIEEYNIHIKYHASKYIGFDAWSEEEDVDLFYQIEQAYQKDEYYKKFTK